MDLFFANPEESVRGWETVAHAQERVVSAVRRGVAGAEGSCAVVGHGGVGTLLLCHLLETPITRTLDQPGQGSWFGFDPTTEAVDDRWQRIPLH